MWSQVYNCFEKHSSMKIVLQVHSEIESQTKIDENILGFYFSILNAFKSIDLREQFVETVSISICSYWATNIIWTLKMETVSWNLKHGMRHQKINVKHICVMCHQKIRVDAEMMVLLLIIKTFINHLFHKAISPKAFYFNLNTIKLSCCDKELFCAF